MSLSPPPSETASAVLSDGPFEPLAPLGQGQFGVVWKALDTRTRDVVAVKTVRIASAQEEALLKAEFRRMSGVSHPNLVFPLELTSHNGTTALVMEYIEGAHLLDHLRSIEPAQRFEALRPLLAQLATALEQIHARGWVHRDVKPANILVTEGRRLVLIDYGFVESVAFHSGDVTGTLAYIAPEVARRESVTPAADWYAVGTMLYELITGHLPFPDVPAVSFTAKLVASEPPSLDGHAGPPGLLELTRRLLEPEPSRRAGLAEVRAFVGVSPTPAADPPTPHEVFVGRDRELSVLNQALREVRPGRPCLVKVNGQPGMGKSTLVSRWLSAVSADPGTSDAHPWILQSRCFERDATPYQALDLVIDHLAGELSRVPKQTPVLRSEAELQALARCFPLLGEVLGVELRPSVDPITDRQLAFAALASLMTHLAGDRPITLWIDDLQWGDADSAELLDVLFGRIEARLLLVISYRSDDADTSELLRSFLGRERPRAVTLELPLGPLDARNATALAAVLAPQLSEKELEPIVTQAEGCPFLVEVIAANRNAGHADVDALGAIDRSAHKELELLRLASISGRPLSLRVVSKVLNEMATHELANPVTQITHLRSNRLLRTTGSGRSMRVDIYHGRLREAVLGRLSEDERRALHRRLADTLIALSADVGVPETDVDPALIARHLGSSDDPSRAGPYAVTAARRAFERLAFEHAAELYRLALEVFVGEGKDRFVLMRSLALAYENAGRGRDAAETLIACAALTVGDQSPLLRRAMDQFFVTGHFASGMPIAISLLEGAGMKWPRSRLRSRLMLFGSLVRLLLMKRRTTPWAGEPPSSALRHRIELVTSLGRGLSAYDGVRGPAFMLEAARLSIRHGYDQLATIGMGFLAFALGLDGKASSMATANKWLAAAETLAAAIDDRRGTHFAMVVRGILDVCRGRWEQARRALNQGIRGLEAECVGVGWERAIARTTALHAYFYGGELVELGRRTDTLVLESENRGDIAAELEGRFYRANVYLVEDEPQRALELVARSIERWTGTDYGYQNWNAIRAETYARLYMGKVDAAFASTFDETLSRARRAGLLGMQLMRFETGYLEGRVQAQLLTRPTLDEAPRRRLSVIARRLRKEKGCLPAEAAAALFEAQLVTDESASRAALIVARSGFETAGMKAHVAALDYRLARLSRDERALTAAAAALKSIGVERPEAFAAMLVG